LFKSFEATRCRTRRNAGDRNPPSGSHVAAIGRTAVISASTLATGNNKKGWHQASPFVS
jgi:hypothetical protein